MGWLLQVKEGDVVEVDMKCPVWGSRRGSSDGGSTTKSGEVQGEEGAGTRWRRSRVVVHEIGASTRSGRCSVKLKRIIEYCSLLPPHPEDN